MKRLLTYIFLFFCLPLKGQDYEISLKHWDAKDGLSHRLVLGIYQDRRGFIWVCTKNGINRFDGYNFKAYTKEKDGLPFNNFSRITEDANGSFWLMGSAWYANNLCIFDPLTKQVQTLKDKTGYKADIRIDFLEKMQDSTVFFGLSDDQFFFTWHPGQGLHKIAYPIPIRKVISKTKDNTFWAQAFSGELCEITMQGKLIKKINTTIVIGVLRADWTSRGGFMPSQGTFVLDSITKKIFKLSAGMKIENASSMLPPKDSSFEDIIFNTGVDEIIYRQGKLYHPQKGLLKDFIKDGEPELKSNVRGVLIDNNGRIWMGNDFGLYMLSIKRNKFRKYFYQDIKIFNLNSYRNIVVDKDNLYTANEAKGIMQTGINKSKSKYAAFLKPAEIRSFVTLIKTHEGTLFGLSKGYLYSLDKNSNKWSLFSLPKDLYDYRYWKIYQVTKDSFLLGTNTGLVWVNINTNIFSPFTKYNHYYELAQALVLDILADRNGQEWICSNTGLYKYDAIDGITARYSSDDTGAHFLPSKDFQHLYLDGDGIYWIATVNGLIKWDKDHNKYQLFTHKDGLSNNNIYAVYEDSTGRLWMSSDYGIMQFNKKNNVVNTYLTDNGITNNEFNRVSHTRDSSGNIYFGTLNGITAFNPKDFKNNDEEEKALALVVTSFEQFNGKTNHIEDKTASLLNTNTITLNPNDRFFTISFVLLTYTDVVHTTYYWKIDDLDSGWNSLKEPLLRLSGLPYGKRMLLIKAQASDGTWGRNELQFQLVVVKPFYLQTWFIILFSIILIIGFIAGDRWRVFSLKKENERLDKTVREKTSALEETINDLQISFRQKDVLMKEINHRVKNNLQVISTLLSLQLANIKDEDAKLSIEESISRISSIALIHQSLYKGDNLTSIEISGFAKELLNQVSSVYGKPGQKMVLQNDVPETWFDIDTALPLGLILNELMTNSYKYVFNNIQNCKIEIKLIHTGSEYILEYCDNGPGLPEDYQREKEGSIGMIIIKNLSKQLGGSFSYNKINNCFIINFKETSARKNIA